MLYLIFIYPHDTIRNVSSTVTVPCRGVPLLFQGYFFKTSGKATQGFCTQYTTFLFSQIMLTVYLSDANLKARSYKFAWLGEVVVPRSLLRFCKALISQHTLPFLVIKWKHCCGWIQTDLGTVFMTSCSRPVRAFHEVLIGRT